jgi:hypothetical protein
MDAVLNRLPPTMQERIAWTLSLRKSDPPQLAALLARKCVTRGSRWFHRNALVRRWWLLCVLRGKSTIRMQYSEESVLSQVFGDDPQFADKFGYTQEYLIAKHFFGETWGRTLERLGFNDGFGGGFKPFLKRYPELIITADMLNTQWSKVVENPPDSWVHYRHPTELDRRFAKLDFNPPPPKRPWYLLRWFQRSETA